MLLMGWIAIVAVVPISRALQPATLYWLIAGGIAYTAGTLFYHNRRIPYSHAIWHLFVRWEREPLHRHPAPVHPRLHHLA